MKRGLINDMRCPYCGGAFEISADVRGDAERLEYGLLRCRCFEFPIVDGVLLLSLAKGYGGPEDEMFPYVPLQVASIEYIRNHDISGLHAWIGRHIPDIVPLLGESVGEVEPYLSLSGRLGVDVAPIVDHYLHEMGRFEVVGIPEATSVRARLSNARRAVRTARTKARSSGVDTTERTIELSRLRDYYAARYFSPRANMLALRLAWLPASSSGRILSLCCGHGVFENVIRGSGLTPDLVSVDAQMVNLLITRRYANSSGSFILHDLQFPLPFVDGMFDGVFSSTCLPEIPAQKTFVEQALRATAPTGWTFFDGIWNEEYPGYKRIDPTRHYRFCQNLFGTLEDYVDMFRECAGPQRSVAVDLPRPTRQYCETAGWTVDPDEVDTRLARREALELSALVFDAGQFPGFVQPAPLASMQRARLSVSPVFEVNFNGQIKLERRDEVRDLDTQVQQGVTTPFPERLALSVDDLADPAFLLDQFCQGNVVFLPPHFDRDTVPLARLGV